MEEGIEPPQTQNKKKKPLLIVGVISVVIAVVLASTFGWYFLWGPGAQSNVNTGGGGGGGNGTSMVIVAPTSVNEGSNFNVTVKNATSPLNGVMVLFTSLTKYTNANGNATFTAPNVNVDTQYDITANKTGYKNVTKIITVVNTGGPPALVFTAKSPPQRSVADANATEWSLDAKFVGCIAHEGTTPTALGWHSWLNIDTSQDTTKVDGKCVYWCYSYYSQSKNRTYSVVVYENGTIPVTNETQQTEIPEEIKNWNIDSVPAASNTMANQTFNDFFQNHQGYTIIYGLKMNDTHVPIWTIMVLQPSVGYPYCYATIDATNGDVVEVVKFP